MDFAKSTKLHYFQLRRHSWLNVQCSMLNTNCILTLPSFASHCKLSKPLCMPPELHSGYDSFPTHLGTMIFIQPSRMLLSSDKELATKHHSQITKNPKVTSSSSLLLLLFWQILTSFTVATEKDSTQLTVHCLESTRLLSSSVHIFVVSAAIG